MTSQAKAKCPGCGDEEGSEALRFSSLEWDDSEYDVEWECGECSGTFKVSEWLGTGGRRTLTDADVEAIARRVVELMGS